MNLTVKTISVTDAEKIQRLEEQLAKVDDSPIAGNQEKIDLMNELAWLLRDKDTKRALELSQAAYALAESGEGSDLPYQAGLAYSLRTQGNINQRLGNHSLGLVQLMKAQGAFQALEIYDALSDVFDGIAGIFYQIGAFPNALKNIHKQLDAAQQVGDKRLIANAYNNLANVYFESGDYEQAEPTRDQSLKFAIESGHTRIECLSYLNIAETRLRAGKYQEALDAGLRGLELCREEGYELFEIYALDILGKTYLKLGDREEGLKHLESALALSRRVDSKRVICGVLLSLGKANLELQQPDLAIESLKQSLSIAHSIHASVEVYKAHQALSEAYEQMGNFSSALQHYKQYQVIQAKVVGDRATLRTKILEIAYQTESAKKEVEFERLKGVELRQEIIERTRIDEHLHRQLDYETALANCSKTLLEFGDSQKGRMQIIHQALEHLQIGFHASRVYLYRNTEESGLGLCLEIFAEACSPGILPLLNHQKDQKTPWAHMPASVFETLQAGKPIGGPIERLFAELPSEFVDLRRHKGPLLSVLFYPIFILDQWWGFVGLDDCADARQWDEEETVILGTASAMIASALRRWQAKDRATLQLSYAQALTACSQVLQTHSESLSESDFQDMLTQALEHLVEASRAGSIKLLENIEDPRMGISSRVVCRTFATESLFEKEELENLPKYRETFLGISNEELSIQAQLQVNIVPWSLFPDEIPRQLAKGNPVGISSKELQESNPLLAEYVSNTVQINSIQFFPIIFNDHWWGTLSLDDRVGRGGWNEDELLMLQAATEIIKNSLQRRQAQLEMRALNNQLEERVEARTAELRDIVKKLSKEVGERERAEQSLQETMDSLEQYLVARTNELATFFDLILMAGQGVDLGEIFEFVALQIMEVTQSHAVSIDVMESDGEHMHLIGQANIPEQAPWRVKISEFPPELRRWMGGPHEPLLVSDLEKEMPSFATAFDFSTYKSYLAAQIKVGDRIKGVLGCYRTEKGGFGLDVVALVTAVAQQLGLILEIDHLRQQASSLAVLEERERLARDLHDSVTQSLYSLSLFSRAGREAAEDGDSERLKTSLAELEDNTLQTLREMRLFLYQLHPAILKEEGLVRALETRFDRVERRAGFEFEAKIEEFTGLSASDEAELYNVVLESMNNIIKHADATQVTLELVHAEDNILLRVVDNGRGFDPSQANGGMGLTNIKERITRLNGQLSISSEPSNGTQVEARIPYQREAN